MCDIWKGNGNLNQLTEENIKGLISSFKELETSWVVMSGGEALMNPNLFRLCSILKTQGLKISILSTGLLLKKYVLQVVEGVDEVIVSLDGSASIHNAIRRVPDAYEKLRQGVQAVKKEKSNFVITGRCVIQKLNYADWPNIIDAAQEIGLDQISFLAADVSTEAFNRIEPWDEIRQSDVSLSKAQIPHLGQVLEQMIVDHEDEFSNGYIAESPNKLRKIYQYYAALQGLGDFPIIECNAPWVSAVIESDGTVRPCYFHRPMGRIQDESLINLLNNPEELTFRRNLDLAQDPICRKCVCTLNLRPTVKVG
jgi:MoaA/NifB/PqqE/SkfB family radical SAM enzyme